MNDDDDLDRTIHDNLEYEFLDSSRQLPPALTLRQIVNHVELTKQSLDLSKKEKSFALKLSKSKDPTEFLENNFFDSAIEDGTEVRNESYGEEGEGGWLGIHRFLGMYVINVTQYGEGEDRFGPFTSKEHAEKVFRRAIASNIP